MGERTGTYGVSVGKVQGRKPLTRLGIVGSIVLKIIFKKWVGSCDWIDLAQERERLF
jgi:hypothetical protein